ncbi:MAG: RIP metalloprotease RseP [Candidatus Auribacterota bacterium]|nr:RIP metalloprotease RseP [Candidatus Auribacterota bacterium]
MMENIINIIISIAKFGIVLGILVFVHELGHFLVARWCGVYVKKFYLGFDIGGLKLFRYKGRETEYGIGILPLGGYVKMAGQEDVPPGDDEAREKLEEENKDIPPEKRFDHKSVSKRVAIIVAGPLMNLILGLVVFIVVAFVGIQVPLYMSDTVIGSVEKNLPAASAGILSGDRVVAVDGEDTSDWEDLLYGIMTSRAGEEIDITISRGEEVMEKRITPEKFRGTRYPRIGIAPGGKIIAWIVQTDSPAYAAGVRAGDTIRGINGRAVLAPIIEEYLSDQEGEEVRMTVSRPDTDEVISAELSASPVSVIRGLYLEKGRVSKVDYRAEGEVLRLKKGDQVMEVDGVAVSPDEVRNLILSASPGSTLELGVERSGWMFFKPSKEFSVSAPVSATPSLEGVMINYSPEEVTVRYSGWKAVKAGMAMAVESVEKMINIFYYMISGRIGTSEVSGPIGIFKITSQVSQFSRLLYLMALISINLGIINLFPFPVLDGGHLVFFLIEAIIRRPLSERFMLIAQQTGLVLIAVLFLLVTYNDILRVLGY